MLFGARTEPRFICMPTWHQPAPVLAPQLHSRRGAGAAQRQLCCGWRAHTGACGCHRCGLSPCLQLRIGLHRLPACMLCATSTRMHCCAMSIGMHCNALCTCRQRQVDDTTPAAQVGAPQSGHGVVTWHCNRASACQPPSPGVTPRQLPKGPVVHLKAALPPSPLPQVLGPHRRAGVDRWRGHQPRHAGLAAPAHRGGAPGLRAVQRLHQVQHQVG